MSNSTKTKMNTPAESKRSPVLESDIATWLYKRCAIATRFVRSPRQPTALDLALSVFRNISCPALADSTTLYSILEEEGMTPAAEAEYDTFVGYVDILEEIFCSIDKVRADPTCTEKSIQVAAELSETARTIVFSPVRGREDGDTAYGRKGQAAALQTPTHPPSNPRTTGHGGGIGGFWSDDGPWVDFSREMLVHQAGRGGGKMSRHQRRNLKKALENDGGSRYIRNHDTCIKGIKENCGIVAQAQVNDRTCLPDAVWNLLRDRDILVQMYGNMPSEGDTSIRAANDILELHALELEPVSKRYISRVQATTAHNILKVLSCKLVVRVKLYHLKHANLYAAHFVAWDGKYFYEDDRKLQINNSTDRTERNSIGVFNRLYHPTKFRRWEITGVYELVHKKSSGT